MLIPGILLTVSYLFLSQFMGIVLSALLQQEVRIGKAVIFSNGLRLQNVSIENGGIFLNVEELLLDMKFHPPGKVGIEKVILNKPLLFLSSAGRRNILEYLGFDKLPPFLTTPPTVIVNNGRLMLKDGFSRIFSKSEIVNVNYLKFNGFTSPVGFNIEIFPDLELCSGKIPAKFKGKVYIIGHISGSKMHARVYFPNLQLGDFKSKDFTACLKLNGNKLSVTEICSTLFDGLLSGWVQVELDRKEYLLGCELFGLNIENLVRDLNPKEKNISGKLDMQLKLSANAEDWRSLRGNGWIKIRDGQLWEVPVLHGLQTLLLKSAFKGAAFREGGCDFKIAEGTLHTENLRLMSEDVGLAAEGKLGFDGKLDFMVTTVFTEEFMAKTPGVINVTSLLSKLLDFFIVQYRIGGTLSKPSYELLPLPVITAIPLQIKRVLRMLFPEHKEASYLNKENLDNKCQ